MGTNFLLKGLCFLYLLLYEKIKEHGACTVHEVDYGFGVVISNIYNEYLKDTPPVAHVQLFPRIYKFFYLRLLLTVLLLIQGR